MHRKITYLLPLKETGILDALLRYEGKRSRQASQRGDQGEMSHLGSCKFSDTATADFNKTGQLIDKVMKAGSILS
jgi:hypothetical protein